MLTPIRWTREARAALHGARTPHPLDPPVPTLELAWQRVVALDGQYPEVKKTWRTFPRAARWLTAVRASFDAAVRPVKLTLEHEVLRLAMVHTIDFLRRSSRPFQLPARELVDFWVASAGVEFVLDVIEAPHLFSIQVDLSSGFDAEFVKPRERGSFVPGHYLIAVPLLRALRPHVLRLDEHAYGKVKKRAERLEKRLVASKHGDDRTLFDVFCFAFAREEKWVNIAARRMCKPGSSIHDGGLILSSVTDASLALQVAKACRQLLPELAAPFAFDVVESLGRAAQPVLELALTHPAKAAQKRNLRAALKLCAA
ncbi:MAG: hypothetical protein JNM17_23525 [Archangium sp.]|nr:hypothetical protein [Archangium sp.]